MEPAIPRLRERAHLLRRDDASVAPPKSILKKRRRIREWFWRIPTFFVGPKYRPYTKPKLTHNDCAFVLLNMHLSFRAFCRMADHAIIGAPINLCVIYTLSHIFICPTLCRLYGFLGRYGERCYISLWDMAPLFQGIAGTMILYECLKLVETALILAKAVLMLGGGYYTAANMMRNVPNVTLVCNGTDVAGDDVGLAREFNELGKPKQHDFGDLLDLTGYVLPKMYVMIGVWLVAMVLVLSVRSRGRRMMERCLPLLTLAFLMSLFLVGLVISWKHDLRFPFLEMGVDGLLFVIAFSLTDYLPSNWVTIGYLNDAPLTPTQVTGTSLLSSLICWGIAYMVEVHTHEFAKAVNMERSCVKSYGLHFFLVVIPYSIRYHGGSVADVLIPVYILVIILKTLSYLATGHQLLLWALVQWRPWMFRFRNLVTIVSFVGLCLSSLFLCRGDNLRRELHTQPFFHTEMTVFLLTLAAFAIYGLRRINADHLYMVESEYPHMAWLKLLLIIGLNLFIMYCLILPLSYLNTTVTSATTILITIIILSPLILGVIKVIILQKRYKWKILRPLTTWGSSDAKSRLERRTLSLRQMFIRRIRRECMHNCLTKNKNFDEEIDEELRMRRMLMNSMDLQTLRYPFQGPLVASPSETFEIYADDELDEPDEDEADGDGHPRFRTLARID